MTDMQQLTFGPNIQIIAYVLLLSQSTKWPLLDQYWANRHHVDGTIRDNMQDKVNINLLLGAGA